MCLFLNSGYFNCTSPSRHHHPVIIFTPSISQPSLILHRINFVSTIWCNLWRQQSTILLSVSYQMKAWLGWCQLWHDYEDPVLAFAWLSCIRLVSESLKQAVGHEAIKLLVNVDEDDYEKGRLVLLQNLLD